MESIFLRSWDTKFQTSDDSQTHKGFDAQAVVPEHEYIYLDLRYTQFSGILKQLLVVLLLLLIIHDQQRRGVVVNRGN